MNTHPGLIGKKLGLTQIFLEDGTAVACTVIQAGSTVVGKRTQEKDGYDALIVGFGEKKAKNVSKAVAGGSITAGARVTADANGAVIAAASAGDAVLGVALAGAASGDIIPVLINPFPFAALA